MIKRWWSWELECSSYDLDFEVTWNVKEIDRITEVLTFLGFGKKSFSVLWQLFALGIAVFEMQDSESLTIEHTKKSRHNWQHYWMFDLCWKKKLLFMTTFCTRTLFRDERLCEFEKCNKKVEIIDRIAEFFTWKLTFSDFSSKIWSKSRKNVQNCWIFYLKVEYIRSKIEIWSKSRQNGQTFIVIKHCELELLIHKSK